MVQGASAAERSDAGIGRPTVSVVIPALNEAANLARVFAAIPDDVHEVLLVDGRSIDETVVEARRLRPDVRIIEQTGSGKGNALACGFHACSGDIIVMLDADYSTDPAEIPAFVTALVDGADFAKGTRFITGGGSADITRSRRQGNRLLNNLVNLLHGTRYTDLCYGYNAFWARHLPVLGLDVGPRIDPTVKYWGDGFEIETLINIRVARAGLRITEVSSFERKRLYGVSNLNAITDGLRVLRIVFSEYRSPRTVVDTEANTAQAEVVVAPTPASATRVPLERAG